MSAKAIRIHRISKDEALKTSVWRQFLSFTGSIEIRGCAVLTEEHVEHVQKLLAAELGN